MCIVFEVKNLSKVVLLLMVSGRGGGEVFSDVGEEHTWPALVGIHYEGLVISQDHRYHYPICPSHVVALAFQNITNVHKEHNITANSLCKPYDRRGPLIEREEF